MPPAKRFRGAVRAQVDDSDEDREPNDAAALLGDELPEPEVRPRKANLATRALEYLIKLVQQAEFAQDGCQVEHAQRELQDSFQLTDVQCNKVINKALREQIVILLEKAGVRFLKYGNTANVDFSRLTAKEIVIYRLIEQAGNTGIWIRELRRTSSLSAPQVEKILKPMLANKLVKAVNTHLAKNKKVYMLYNIIPAPEVTGAAWYAGHRFDTEFFETLCRVVSTWVVREPHGVVVEQLVEKTNRSGLFTVEIPLDDMRAVLETLVRDGGISLDLQANALNKFRRRFRDIATSGPVYRKPYGQPKILTSEAAMPCTVCPVRLKCTPGGDVSPESCVYYEQWLSMPLKDDPLQDLSQVPAQQQQTPQMYADW